MCLTVGLDLEVQSTELWRSQWNCMSIICIFCQLVIPNPSCLPATGEWNYRDRKRERLQKKCNCFQSNALRWSRMQLGLWTQAFLWQKGEQSGVGNKHCNHCSCLTERREEEPFWVHSIVQGSQTGVKVVPMVSCSLTIRPIPVISPASRMFATGRRSEEANVHMGLGEEKETSELFLFPQRSWESLEIMSLYLHILEMRKFI